MRRSGADRCCDRWAPARKATLTAERLNLPFQVALAKTDDRPERKTMENSSQQARNIDGSLAVVETLLPGPVLLVGASLRGQAVQCSESPNSAGRIVGQNLGREHRTA